MFWWETKVSALHRESGTQWFFIRGVSSKERNISMLPVFKQDDNWVLNHRCCAQSVSSRIRNSRLCNVFKHHGAYKSHVWCCCRTNRVTRPWEYVKRWLNHILGCDDAENRVAYHHIAGFNDTASSTSCNHSLGCDGAADSVTYQHVLGCNDAETSVLHKTDE